MKPEKFATALALAAFVGACHHGSETLDEGVPLSKLDLSGPAPHKLALLGPDTVRLQTGDKLAITIDGDGDKAEGLRFTLKHGTLGILRKGSTPTGEGVTVHVTMPAPGELSLLGSGKIIAAALAPEAKVNIAGSGDVEADHVAGETLKVNLAGTGNFHTAGTVGTLKVNIAGTGDASMEGLKADKANISIAGTGDSRFASDGKVSANILGSGSVYVAGRAECEIHALGTGKLVCQSPGKGRKKG